LSKVSANWKDKKRCTERRDTETKEVPEQTDNEENKVDTKECALVENISFENKEYLKIFSKLERRDRRRSSGKGMFFRKVDILKHISLKSSEKIPKSGTQLVSTKSSVSV
jgi:hypothetical protein